ncbi:MAG: hypothetical protein LBT98_04100, partial [Puniceicoccales bacterium]|nr:hypothetical protein [Puniceicoccales bacterium]
MNTAHSSQLTAHSSQLTAHSSQPTATLLAIALFSLGVSSVQGVFFADGYNEVATFLTLTAKNTPLNNIRLNSSYLGESAFGNLNSGDFEFKYALVIVAPKKTGTFKAGIIDAKFDPVMIFYDGYFNPDNPRDGVSKLNDDTSGTKHQEALENDKLVVDGYNPQITFDGYAGNCYSFFITTYNCIGSQDVDFPIQFYVTGDAVIQLWNVEDWGPVTPDGTANLLKFGTPKPAPSFFHGALAELGLEVDRICWGLGHCDELHPRPKAWFFRGFHSHLHR